MTASKTASKHDADVAFVEALARVLCENDLTELRVKRDGGDTGSLNVRVSRGANTAADVAPPAPASAAAPTTAPGDSDSDDPAQHPGAVTSPMVGTAYLATEPGTAPFVSVGDQVAEGDTLMIVEAMKTMNHIPVPRSGTVKRVLVADGDPVEFGAPLMIVE